MRGHDLKVFLIGEGYLLPRRLPDGRWVAVMPMIYTTGLFVGLDTVTYDHRYCYEHAEDAIADIMAWDGQGHPPGPWIKRKGAGGDLLNPAWANDHARDGHVQSP